MGLSISRIMLSRKRDDSIDILTHSTFIVWIINWRILGALHTTNPWHHNYGRCFSQWNRIDWFTIIEQQDNHTNRMWPEWQSSAPSPIAPDRDCWKHGKGEKLMYYYGCIEQPSLSSSKSVVHTTMIIPWVHNYMKQHTNTFCILWQIFWLIP